MKEMILILTEDPTYSKKFCNQASKLYGKKYVFVTISDIKALKVYANENKVDSLITTSDFEENLDDIKVSSIYILNEKGKSIRREGKRSYIYKLQNIKKILDVIDNDIQSKYSSKGINNSKDCKLYLFYSPITILNKLEIVRRIAKQISKKKKVLVVDLDEFENYKGNVGLSNIIFNYKENNMSMENLKREICTEKEIDIIKSITYPEDFNVITNVDLANIVNELKKMQYDYVFVNADSSYVKCQYILNDADSIILVKDKNNTKLDIFKNYVKTENQIDFKKITELDLSKIDRAYLTAFIKECFEGKDV